MYSTLGKYTIMKFNKTQNNETQETQMKIKKLKRQNVLENNYGQLEMLSS